MNEMNIEVSIPMRYLDGGAVDECPICMYDMCTADECHRRAARLSCCQQCICAKCFVNILRRCKCSSRCRHIIGECPFCRDMCRADALDLFCGYRSPCVGCVAIGK